MNWLTKKSKIHGMGIYASKDIPKNTKIIEYIGEKISKKEGDIRSEKRIKKYLNSKKTGSVYIFELNSKYDIDGTPKYNKARYINHSCNPNSAVRIAKSRIWIYSIKKIKKGNEISYDYGYEFDKDDYTDHVCKCGERKCIGFIISSDDIPKFKKHVRQIKNKKK